MIVSSKEMSDPIDHSVRRALLKWRRTSERELPWRSTKDPYRIWVSEVMLQQTQVATVIPYYARFLAAFPTIEKLARAPFEEVAAKWSGLGYYRRARCLHQAAQKMVKEFGGRFPENYETARTLPGVGPYTASAVLSLAYGKPLPVLDGNVARVVARLNALRGNLHRADFRIRVERHLSQMISRRKPGIFNEAMMDLGQTVCLPRAPRCSLCPVGKFCAAFRCGRPEFFPEKRPRRATELHYLASAVIQRDGKVALAKGLDEGLLSELWNFPAAFGVTSEEARDKLRIKLQFAPDLRITRRFGALRHTITFRSIRVELYEVTGSARAPLRWFRTTNLSRAAISQLAKKIASAVSEHCVPEALHPAAKGAIPQHPRAHAAGDSTTRRNE